MITRKYKLGTILVLFLMCILKVQSQEYEILNRKYESVYNKTMNIPKPRWIQYRNNKISFILDNKSKFEMINFQDQPKKGLKDNRVQQNLIQYIDAKGMSYDLMKGEIRTTGRNIIATRDGYKTFLMVPDRERASIYFIARPDSHPPGEGSLFAMDTSRVSGDTTTKEIEFLGEHIFALGIDPSSGNMAIGSKISKGWMLTVLRKLDKMVLITTTTTPQIEATAAPMVVIKPTIPTITSTTVANKIKSKLPTLDGRFDELALEEIMAVSIESIRAVFSEDLVECLSLQRRVDAMLKNFKRTLDLTDTEIGLIRKENLPPIISMVEFDNTIASEINKIFENIIEEYKKGLN